MFNQIGELNSKVLNEQLERQMAADIGFCKSFGIVPRLDIFNDNLDYQPSVTYSHKKVELAQKLGMVSVLHENPDTDAVKEAITLSGLDPNIHGVILQCPSADFDRTPELVQQIDPIKDVDGLTEKSVHMPATADSVRSLLDFYGIDILNEDTLLLGRGVLVNGPLERYCQQHGAKGLVVCDKDSKPMEILEALNKASLVITAMGLPHGIVPEMFYDQHPRSIIDAGATELDKTVMDGSLTSIRKKVVGDVSDEMRQFALANGWNITPEIGGVGPITVRMLLRNTIKNAKNLT